MVAPDERLLDDQYALLFNIRRSRRYHLWRVKFYQRFNNIRLIVFLISSSSSYALIMTTSGWDGILPYTSGVVVLLAILEIVLKMGRLETQHRDLAKSFVLLEKEIIRTQSSLDRETLDWFESEYLELESDEPPPLSVLNDLCYNEEVRARYPDQEWDGKLIEVQWHRRILASIVDLSPHAAKMRPIEGSRNG